MYQSYYLEAKKDYRFLRLPEETDDMAMNRIKKNVEKFEEISTILGDLEFNENQISVIFSIITAILNLGETKFQENDESSAVIGDKQALQNFAELVDVDSKKICWALSNYCLIRNGEAVRKRNSCHEARDARDVLANTLYARLVDYIVNEVNSKLAIGKRIL